MIFIVFIVGLVFGSFLNVLIYRIPRGEDFTFSRSKCTSCGYVLKWYDLVPVLSYATLGGKCRKCKTSISIMYPLIEVINALAYVFIYYLFDISVSSVIYMFVFSMLLVASVIDLEWLIIPNGLVISILIVAIFYMIYDGNYVSHIIGFFLVSSLLFLISVITKGGIGMGDVKLMAAGGLLVGAVNVFATLVIASVVGSIVGVSLILLKKVDRKDKIPFGPFLAFGLVAVMLFGNEIIDCYFNLIM